MDRRQWLALSLMVARPTVAPASTGSASTGPMEHGTLRWALATGYRADAYHARNLQRLGTELLARTQGAFGLDIRADNSLVPLAGIPEAVSHGQPPVGEAIMSGMSQRWPICAADAVPFLTQSLQDAQRLWHVQRPLVEEALRPSQLGVLLAVPWPGQGLYTSHPVASTEDLRGSRMRTYNSTTQRIAQLLGATPVDVPTDQIGRALADGRIDSLITSPVTGVEQQVWRWLPYFYDLNAWMPKNLVMVHLPSLQGLPADHRQALLELSAQAELRGWALCKQAGQEALQTLQAHRVQTTSTPTLFARSLNRMGERFSREWMDQLGPRTTAAMVAYFTER
jgi:TRAP-type transport system periplasmic protein